jgi:hypothetical protein
LEESKLQTPARGGGAMKNIAIAMLAIGIVLCGSALSPAGAQHANGSSSVETNPKGKEQRASQSNPWPTEFVITRIVPLGVFSSSPTGPFVFKDGAVYFVFSTPKVVVKKTGVNGAGAVSEVALPNILLPMPGGGASGCFSVDLGERIELLRKSIEEMPPNKQKQ